jgi:two-component system cell cycle response regulator
MMESGPLRILLACGDSTFGEGMAAALREAGATMEAAVSIEAALQSIAKTPGPALVCIDADLPGMDESAMTALRSAAGERLPIVLISDSVDRRWREWLAAAMIDDLIPKAIPFEGASVHLRLRLEMVLRAFARRQELRTLREASARNAQFDPVTGLYNRAALLSLLFRETDRVQRMGTCLAMIVCDVNGRGERGGVWRQSLTELVPRLNRLLRSYDLLGEVRPCTLLMALPGCNEENAVRLAERARAEVFSVAGLGGASPALSETCFGVAESHGRSPLIVLREAEQALWLAKAAGTGSIRASGLGAGRNWPAATARDASGLAVL